MTSIPYQNIHVLLSLLCLLIAMQSTSSLALAQTPLIITTETQSVFVGPYVHFLKDESNSLDIKNVVAAPDNRWLKHDKPIFNQGYSTATYWLSFNVQLDHLMDSKQRLFLEFDLPFFGSIDFILFKNGQLVEVNETGLSRPMSQMPYPHEAFVLPLMLEPEANYRIIIRAESVSAILVPLTLYKETVFHQHHVSRNTFLGFYFGLTIILALYNFFLYLSTKDFNYLLYTIHVFGLCWLQAALRGFTATHIWQDEYRAFAYYEPTMVIWVSFCTSLLFSRSFLKLPQLYPKWNIALRTAFLISLFFLVGTFVLPMHFVLASFNIFSPIAILLVISVAIYSQVKGNRAARFFLLAWSFFLTSAMIKTIYHLGWLPTNFLTTNPMIIGSAIEGVLLSLALADRINWIRHEKDEAQQKAVEALEYSNRIKDDFLISISHELRTPLAGIMGALSLSKNSTNIDELTSNNKLIEKSSDRMSDTIDSILCLSEISSGDIRLFNNDFELHNICAELFGSIDTLCKEKHINFHHEIKAPPHQLYNGDANKIRLILMHLLQNAARFTEKGNISILIEATEQNSKSGLLCNIYDTGAGIAQQKLDMIFEAFQQVSAGYSRTHEGLGIGLTICKRLVELMQGSIEVESKEGLGTHFTVFIPTTVSQHPASENQTIEFEEQINAMVVEDNIVNQKVLMGMLKKLNCKTVLACNGREALEMVRQQKPDIIFMDCQMPVMDGIEATQELRKTYSKDQLPIIAVTANALSNDRERCFRAGMNDYLVKPVKSNTLQETLKNWPQMPPSTHTSSEKPVIL